MTFTLRTKIVAFVAILAVALAAVLAFTARPAEADSSFYYGSKTCASNEQVRVGFLNNSGAPMWHYVYFTPPDGIQRYRAQSFSDNNNHFIGTGQSKVTKLSGKTTSGYTQNAIVYCAPK